MEKEIYYKKKIFYLCSKRGMKENELLLRAFAEHHLDCLSSQELEDFETLLQVPDSDLLNWLSSTTEPPLSYQTPIFHRLLTFSRKK